MAQRKAKGGSRRVKAKVAPAPPPRPEMASRQTRDFVDVYSPDGRVFTERHPDHPGGEVWIAGDGLQASETVTVARTLAVERAIRAGRLKEVPKARARTVSSAASEG